MAESWVDVLNKVSKKKNPKAINIVVLQPPKQPIQNMRMGYTGAGANGVVEPAKPAMFDAKTGSIYHEGEGVLPTPGGKQIVPASQMPGMITPATEAGQARLNTLEAPGFASGGYASNTNPLDFAGGTGPSQQTINAANQQASTQQSVDAVMPPLVSPSSFAGGTGPSQQEIALLNANKIQGTGIATGVPSSAPVLAPPLQINREAVAPKLPTSAPVTPLFSPAPQAKTPTETATVSPPTPLSTPPIGASRAAMLEPFSPLYKTGAEEGYGQIRDISRGQSAVNEDIRSRTMNYLDANAAANDAATIARLRSEGASPEEINAYMLNQNRSNEIQRAGAMKDIAISEGQRAEGASRDLATLGRSAYEADRSMARTEKLDAYSQAMDRVNLALQVGDYATAGTALSNAFPGTTIDFGKLVTAENSKNFDAAVQSLNSYVKMGIDIDKIPAQAKATILQAFGGNEYEMEQFYESLKQQGNVFEEELNAIMQYYPDATPAERNDIAAALRVTKAKELGLKTDPKTGRIIGFEVPGEVAEDLKPPEGVTVGTNKVYVSQNGTLMRNAADGPVPVTDPTALDKVEQDEILEQYPSSTIAESIVQRRVQAFLDTPETFTMLDLNKPADKRVYEGIISSPITKDGAGSIGDTDLIDSAKNENYTLSNLIGLSKNAPVKINGKLYLFDREEEKAVTGFKNSIFYFLRDAATGEMYRIGVIDTKPKPFKHVPELIPLEKTNTA